MSQHALSRSPLTAILTLFTAAACQPSATPEAPASPEAPAVQAVESAVRTPVARQSGPPLHYTLRFPDAATHMIDVELQLPEDLQDRPELWMPTWIPGSYLIREYARHVEQVEARAADGSPLPVRRVAKNRWAVDGRAGTVRYRVYGGQRSVRGSFVDSELGVINGPATFLLVEGAEGRAHRVVAEPAPGWQGAWTGLDATAGAAGGMDWTAADIDELIDSPIVLGTAAVADFQAGERDHRLVIAGSPEAWDLDRARDDVAAIVRTTHALWGTVPYEHYDFLNLSTGGRGGLEHLDSTLMISHPRAMTQRKRYLSWLGLVSHEFFHTWNVKRLRPAPLGPFDYEVEAHTPSLWVAEGLTSYYDDLLLIRAGLMTEQEYLERISDQVGKLQQTPGRLVQTLENASAEAWIKHYRKDENTVNTAISYYTKGMAVGWLLDAHIRAATDDQKSLDDALRLAFSRHSGPVGYTPGQWEAVLHETIGDTENTELKSFLDHALRTTGELDYAPALAHWGLRWAPPKDADGDAADDAPPAEPPPGWLGAELEATGGRTRVKQVKRGTPAHEAGLQVGDELIAIDGWRVPPKGPQELWKEVRPGQVVRLSISRRQRLRTVEATLGEVPAEAFVLEVDPDAPPEAAERRRRWLGLPSSPESAAP
jgi:predicted metalloprotease with PDZ domain